MADLKSEVAALHKISKALEPFSPHERIRLLHFSLERQGEQPPPPDPYQEGLGGQELARAAVEVLEREGRNGCSPEAAHYREWFDLVIEAGVEVRGRDPLATFLTNIARHGAVESTNEPGVFRLRGGQ